MKNGNLEDAVITLIAELKEEKKNPVVGLWVRGLLDKWDENRGQDWFAYAYGTEMSSEKQIIMSFLEWAELYKDATLFHYDGVKESEPFINSFEWEELVDEFLYKDKE